MIHQLDPSVNGLIDPSEDPLSLAQRVIDGARALGVETFLRASDILSGNPRLALGFTAQLFNTCGLKFNIQGVVLARYINLVLKDDASVTHLLPLNPFSADIYLKQSDGRILAGLLNHAIPDTINVSELIAGPNLGNVLAVLVTAREIGAELGNLNAEEVFDGRYDCMTDLTHSFLSGLYKQYGLILSPPPPNSVPFVAIHVDPTQYWWPSGL